jgi:peptidyl-prolyl cis-trans isomerase SurA
MRDKAPDLCYAKSRMFGMNGIGAVSPRIFALSLFSVVAIAVAGARAQDVHIAAVVNDDVITTEDLDNRVTLLLRSSGIKDDQDTRQRLGARTLRTLIDEKLQLQEAKLLNVSAPKEDVDAALARIEQQNGLAKGGLDKYLQASGIPRASLVDQVTAAIAWSRVIQARLTQDVSVTDDQVADAIKRNKESANTPLSQVSEIFLAVDNPSQEDEVKRLADRLEQQLHGGGNFASIAQQFSQSPTAAEGGSLGWITANEISPPLAQALEQMKAGDLSEPIRAGGGYYILGLVDRRLPGEASPEDTQISVVEAGAGFPPNAPPDFRTHLNQALQELIAASKSCAAFLAAAHKIGLPYIKDAPRIRAGTLSPPVRRVTLALSIGEVSKPFPVQGGVGIIMLCDRKDPPAPTPPTPEQMRESLAREQLDVLARRYLRDLRRGAYVDIRG